MKETKYIVDHLIVEIFDGYDSAIYPAKTKIMVKQSTIEEKHIIEILLTRESLKILAETYIKISK